MLQDLHFDQTLFQIRWLVLDDFHSYELAGGHISTFGDLPKGSGAQHIEYHVPVSTL